MGRASSRHVGAGIVEARLSQFFIVALARRLSQARIGHRVGYPLASIPASVWPFHDTVAVAFVFVPFTCRRRRADL
jgi:hypothetical protein